MSLNLRAVQETIPQSRPGFRLPHLHVLNTSWAIVDMRAVLTTVSVSSSVILVSERHPPPAPLLLFRTSVIFQHAWF